MNASLRRVRALTVKEFRQIVRDPSSLLIAFALPFLLLFLFGYGLSLDAEHVRLGVALEDGGPEARALAEAFRSTKYFDARIDPRRRLLEDELEAGRLRGVVVIPSDFTARLRRTDGASPLLVLSDGTEPNTAAFVENYARGVLATWLRQRAMDAGVSTPAAVELRPRVWFNAELASRNVLVPGCVAIVLALVGTLLTALVVAREWERGTMEALLATPVRMGELLVSKTLPYFLLGMGSAAVSLGLAHALFGVPFHGSFAALALVAASFLLPSLALGLFLSTASKNQFVAAQAALITAFLPVVLLSGFIFDVEGMPLFLRVLTRILPARYFVPALRTALLAGDVGAVILPCVAAMLFIGSVLLTLTLRKSAKRLETP